MMRFMPFMFLIFLYFFSSALVLYWTVQNLMTILQTLITKREPLKGESKEIKGNSTEKFDRNDGKQEKIGLVEISEEERKYRNFLGLKLKGPINKDELERLYKERLSNYSENKLAEMTASKRKASLQKKEKAEIAYKFLSESLDKES